MKNKLFYNIFKSGSKTYFYSSIFFPKEIKEDVFTLYAFVRTADNFVDAVPQNKSSFMKFVANYELALKGRKVDDPIINPFVGLMKKYNFDKKWVRAFLDAMKSDLTKHEYNSLEELETYMYGSAEVIGLMMSRILRLPREADKAAMLQGKAMQYLNFIRDIDEDNSLGRQYIPLTIRKAKKLKSLRRPHKNDQDKFESLIKDELMRYDKWQTAAYAGYSSIPWRYRVPIRTSAMLYSWTAKKIGENPTIVFSKKVKPSIFKIFLTLGKATIR